MGKEGNNEEFLDDILNSDIGDGDTEDIDKWFENELDDMDDINIEDITEEDEEIDDLMKMLDMRDEEGQSDSNNIEKSEKIAKADNTDSFKEEELSNNFKDNIKEMSVDGNSKKNKKRNKKDKEKDKKDKEENKRGKEKNKKDKKFSTFGGLFSKKDKDKTEDLNLIDEKEILDEMGSAFDEMKEFSIDDDIGIDMKSTDTSNDSSADTKNVDKSEELFADIDNLDDIPEIGVEDKKKKKKEKKVKEKKEKKRRPPKEKKVKVKKEKKTSPDEYINISPLFLALTFSIIIVVVLAIYFGANTFSYNENIDKSTSYYVSKEYTKSYNILSGMKLKDDDKDFYNQVENIMKVEKHINDFDTYMELEKYAYALEALVRGVESFDENLNRASELGTYDILIESSEEIDTFLKSYFDMSIEEARSLNQLDDKSEYSKIINEKSTNINISSEEGTQD